MFVSSVVDLVFEHDRIKPKTIKLVFTASLLGTQYGVRAKMGWLRFRVMCPEWSDMFKHALLFQ